MRDNILYGRPNASEEELFAAAKQAQAHRFIRDLADPNGLTGYNAQVGERGVKLSGRSTAEGVAGTGDPKGRANPSTRRSYKRA